LPSGCTIRLGEQTQRQVLSAIRRSLGANDKKLVEAVRDAGEDAGLGAFLDAYELELPDLYAKSRSWTLLRRTAGLGGPEIDDGEAQALREVQRLVHADAERRLALWRTLADDPDARLESEAEARLARMLFGILYGLAEGSDIDALRPTWRRHGALRAEVRQLVDVLQARASSRRWPTISSRLRGRMRSASGCSAAEEEPSRSPVSSGVGAGRLARGTDRGWGTGGPAPYQAGPQAAPAPACAAGAGAPDPRPIPHPAACAAWYRPLDRAVRRPSAPRRRRSGIARSAPACLQEDIGCPCSPGCAGPSPPVSPSPSPWRRPPRRPPIRSPSPISSCRPRTRPAGPGFRPPPTAAWCTWIRSRATTRMRASTCPPIPRSVRTRSRHAARSAPSGPLPPPMPTCARTSPTGSCCAPAGSGTSASTSSAAVR